MNLIQENPYRIIGIIANASEKEIQKQKSKLLRYASIGKQAKGEFDVSFLDKIERDENQIKMAFSKIEQNQDKINHALFWFVNSNSFDETAIGYLMNNDCSKALEIWERITNGKDITPKNYSCFNNVGTLKLVSTSQEEIKEGIHLKLDLILSDSFIDFIHLVADQTYIVDKEKELERFINHLLDHYSGNYSKKELIQLFQECDALVLNIIHRKLTEEPIYIIESNIDTTNKERRIDKNATYELGLDLFEKCKNHLDTLASILGNENLTYKMLADNLAKEVMQCGIDYFTLRKDTENPSAQALELLQKAQSITQNSQTKDRIKENIKGIEEWNKTAPIKEELEFITQSIANFQKQAKSIENAKSLVLACKPKLDQMKAKIGETDEYYLMISGAVVNTALNTVIEFINDEQEIYKAKSNIYARDNTKIILIALRRSNGVQAESERLLNDYLLNTNTGLSNLRIAIRKAIDASYAIRKLDMDAKLKTHYNNNHSILESIASQLQVSISSFGDGNSGCLASILICIAILFVILLT